MNRPEPASLAPLRASWSLSCSNQIQVTAAGALPCAGGFFMPCQMRPEAARLVGPVALREAAGLSTGGRG